MIRSTDLIANTPAVPHTVQVMVMAMPVESLWHNSVQLPNSFCLLHIFSSAAAAFYKKKIGPPRVLSALSRSKTEESASSGKKNMQAQLQPGGFDYMFMALLAAMGIILIIACMAVRVAIKKDKQLEVVTAEAREAKAKVKSLLREMETFVYSVSHDLRAPLRSIDGYARILQEDYLHKFDDDGKRVIQVIMNNSRRMSKLIDDLLDLSRLARKDILPMPMNMTQMVKNLAQELIAGESARKISIEVNPLPPCVADPEMMHQVWENLLSNAIKFTGKMAHATIEVSAFEMAHASGYHIRDNGVGFDMQYAGKLFSVFQRLHKVQEFGGTGVGLAIVKHIVERHGGRIWAEGKVNGGATFYFTIPNPKQ